MTNIDTQETDYSVYTWCVTVSVLSKTGKVEKTSISNALKKIGCKNTWEDFLEKLLDDGGSDWRRKWCLGQKKCKRDRIYWHKINKNVLGRSFCQVLIMRFIWWTKKYFTYLPTHYLEGRVAKGETNNFLRLASSIKKHFGQNCSQSWIYRL